MLRRPESVYREATYASRAPGRFRRYRASVSGRKEHQGKAADKRSGKTIANYHTGGFKSRAIELSAYNHPGESTLERPVAPRQYVLLHAHRQMGYRQ